MIKVFRLIAEIFAALIGITVILGLLLIWRLSDEPIRTSFLTPYIASSIERLAPGSHTDIARSLLSWDGTDQSVSLHLDAITVTGDDHSTIALLPSMGIKLNVFGLVLGQFLPSELNVDHLQIWLDRRNDGRYYFGNNPTASVKSDQGFDGILESVINSLAHAYITRKLTIRRVVIQVHDEQSMKDWAIQIPEMTLRHGGLGLTGVAKLNVSQQQELSTITVQYSYDARHGLHTFMTQLNQINPSFLVGGHPQLLGLGALSSINLPLSGDFAITVNNQNQLMGLGLKMHGDKGSIIQPDLWDSPTPRNVSSINLDFTFDRNKKLLLLPRADFDFAGATLSLSAKGTVAQKSNSDMIINSTVDLTNWPIDDLSNLWPRNLLPNPRAWIIANVHRGYLDKGHAELKGSIKFDDLGNPMITDLNAHVMASHATLHYIDGMPDVSDVNADAIFDINQAKISVKNGAIGNIKTLPFTVLLSGFEDTTQYASIPLMVHGPLPEVITLINNPPLRYAEQIGIKPSDLAGEIEGTVYLKFPLLATILMKDIEVKVDANIAGLTTDKIVHGYTIADGKYALALTKHGLDLKGPMTVNGAPFDLAWKQNFDRTATEPFYFAKITGMVDGKDWPTLGLTPLKGTKGSSKLEMTIKALSAQHYNIEGTLDLTPSSVNSDLVDWIKPANEPAILHVIADVPETGPIAMTTLTLSGPHVAIKGNALLNETATDVLNLHLNPFQVGHSDASVDLTTTGDPTEPLAVLKVRGSSLDVSGLRQGADEAVKMNVKKIYDIIVDQLITSHTGVIKNPIIAATRKGSNWLTIKLNGLADGTEPISMDLKPEGNHRTFDLRTNNFGKALKGLGFTDTVNDGQLIIHGLSTDENPDLIVGDIRLNRVVVRKLPVLALLLNATSPLGFSGLVTDSVTFDRARGRFKWGADKVDFIHLNAKGPAMGINIEGPLDLNFGNSGLYGTIVPFSFINNTLNFIPILGHLITGGENGGVFVIAYKIGGTLAEPKIIVNPVSLLTPGFLGSFFFDSEDQDDTGDDDSGPAYPHPAQHESAPSNINQHSH